MRRTLPFWILALGLFALAPAVIHAQEAADVEAAAEEEPSEPYSTVMMHHITDGYEIAIPWFNAELEHTVDLHEVFGHWVVNVGGHEIDFTPSRYVIFMWIVVALLFLVFAVYGRRRYDENGVPKGMNNLVEVLVVFVRDEIAIATIGKKDGPRYVPFILTLFFFILFANLLGLLPYSSTITNTLSVTGALALIAFVGIEYAGMRAQGVVGYWKHLVPSGVPFFLWPIMLPIEFVGLFTKPFALMVRLFANMTAGHVVILSLLGLIFILKTAYVAPASVAFALFIYLLELLVAFIQAYIFAMLTSLFIGLASHPH